MKNLPLASIRLVLIVFLLSAPLLAQQKTYPITGSVSILSDWSVGDTASAGPFSYRVYAWDVFPHVGFCTPGQLCTLDADTWSWIGFDPPIRLEMQSSLGNLSTPWVQSDLQIKLPPFITPDVPEDGLEHEITLPAIVSGTVRALYQDALSQTRWDVWVAKVNGSGTAAVSFFNLGPSSGLNATSFNLSYTGTAAIAVKFPWIPAPGVATSGIAYDGRSLFVSDVAVSGLTTINQLDPNTGDVLRSFLSPSPAGFDGRGNPSDLTFLRDHLVISDVGTAGAGRVFEIAPDASRIFDSFALPFRGGAIASDVTRLFVGDLDSSRFLVISPFGRQSRTFANSMRPAGMAFDRGNNLLWVVDQLKTGVVSQVTTKGRVLRTCQGPWSIGDLGLGGIALLGNQLGIAEISGFEREDYDPPRTIVSLPNWRNLNCSPALPISVRLDIKPGVFPNSIDPASSGLLAVAILGAAKFDASSINPKSLRFGQTGQEAGAEAWRLQDINSDGYPDLLAYFVTRNADFVCGVTLASVTGRTYAGKEIRGTDSVEVLGCQAKPGQ